MTRPPDPATKTGRARIARMARRHGYFHNHEEFTVAVKCPLCSERVSGHQPAPGESVTKALDALMATHLQYDCPKGPQQ